MQQKHLPALLMFFTQFYTLVNNYSEGQNLVPNPSFEDTVYCPFEASQLSATEFWYNPSQGSPDYFHSCSPVFGAGSDLNVPYNFMGYQTSYSGNGYAGWAVSFDTIVLNYREYLQVQLSSPLTAGKKYIVSAYMVKADSGSLALKDIGIALSKEIIGGSYPTPISFAPQIIYPQYLTDTVNWIEISDTIWAVGGEKYLTIGYFKDNNISDSMSILYGSINYDKVAYYYVDAVSIIEDTSTSIEAINSLRSETYIYPNPANNIFNIKSNNTIEKIELINEYGEKIKTYYRENNYDISKINQGIYFIKVIFKKQNSFHEKIIIKH